MYRMATAQVMPFACQPPPAAQATAADYLI